MTSPKARGGLIGCICSLGCRYKTLALTPGASTQRRPSKDPLREPRGHRAESRSFYGQLWLLDDWTQGSGGSLRAGRPLDHSNFSIKSPISPETPSVLGKPGWLTTLDEAARSFGNLSDCKLEPLKPSPKF